MREKGNELMDIDNIDMLQKAQDKGKHQDVDLRQLQTSRHQDVPPMGNIADIDDMDATTPRPNTTPNKRKQRKKTPVNLWKPDNRTTHDARTQH